ncbi:MAG: AAA family ATPase [Mesorhizobium sp.]|nr:MAG: AAA family ATPase [Mesorhizobium sp.]
MAWIRAERVRHALQNLNEWRKTAQAQGSMHLLPLLALLERGASPGTEVEFNETPDEYAFWDKYFRLDSDPDKPYFNAMALRRAEKGFPHSNAATVRKNTFALKWKAADRRVDDGSDYWTLANDYADIFRDKALTKGGVVSRVPVVDLAALMFRNEEIPTATAEALEAFFRARFPQDDDSYRKIFVFHAEKPENIFTDVAPGPEMRKAIEDALIADTVAPSTAPAPIVAPATADPEDELLAEVRQLLTVGTSGIILSGPPGTGKTYHARRIAKSLVKDEVADIFRVQFHPSFGYEDFVEGYRPAEGTKSGFEIVPKVFIKACERASSLGDEYVVVIVDEINRGDPARIFGELLTYLERSYRGEAVTLPFSGDPLRIPENLLMVGTMNPHDRSVSHIDAAFVRRFDHIQIEPSREALEDMLDERGMPQEQVDLITDWFDRIQKMFLPLGLGHAVFADVTDIDTLKVIWRYRIRPAGEALLDFDVQRRDGFISSFEALMRKLEGGTGD